MPGLGGAPRAGDVQVRPRGVSREVLEEQRSGDRAAGDVGVARLVGDVGDIGVQARAVGLDERHPPRSLAAGFPRGHQRLPERVVGAVERGMGPAQAQGRRSGERGDVDEHVGLGGGPDPRHRVGEHHAPLGIGVGHLDARAVVGAHDVPGPVGGRTDGVLREWQHPDHPVGQLELRGGQHGGQHGGGPGHVGLHPDHRVAGLDRDATGVEGDALAHQRHRAARPRAGRVGDGDQARWGRRTGADGEQRTEAVAS